MPFIDQQALYEKIDLSQPWNSPANEEAYHTFLAAYSCPSERLTGGLTTYQAIVGTEAFFDPVTKRILRDISDGTSNTLAIAEVNSELAVHWMSPFDHAKEFLLTLQPKSQRKHTGGTHVAIGDGSIRFISDALDLKTRRALITINGGESIGDF